MLSISLIYRNTIFHRGTRTRRKVKLTDKYIVKRYNDEVQVNNASGGCLVNAGVDRRPVPERSRTACSQTINLLGGSSAMKEMMIGRLSTPALSRRTLLRTAAGLAGGALLPAGLMPQAFAEDHPAIGTYPAGSSGSSVSPNNRNAIS
jgi:hypothetical protein